MKGRDDIDKGARLLAKRRDRRRTERPLPSARGALTRESAAHMIRAPGF